MVTRSSRSDVAAISNLHLQNLRALCTASVSKVQSYFSIEAPKALQERERKRSEVGKEIFYFQKRSLVCIEVRGAWNLIRGAEQLTIASLL